MMAPTCEPRRSALRGAVLMPAERQMTAPGSAQQILKLLHWETLQVRLRVLPVRVSPLGARRFVFSCLFR